MPKFNKKLMSIVFGLGAFGTLTASAATLGGLNSSSLGADQTVIASCDTDGIALSYTNTYDPATNAYKTSAVTMSGIAVACNAKTFKLTLSGGTVSLGESSGAVVSTTGATTQTVTLATPVDAKSITNASLVITG